MPKGQIILRFYRKEVKASLDRAWSEATKQLAREIEPAIKQSVSQPYPPPSRPGRLPHRRSGNFRSGIRVTGGKTLTIQSGALYGGYLEDGTSKMDPRPWARRQFIGALGKKWARRLKEILKGKLRGRRR